jgi:hypothetical protein
VDGEAVPLYWPRGRSISQTSFGPRNIPNFETVTRRDANFQQATVSTRMGYVRALDVPKYHDATTSQCTNHAPGDRVTAIRKPFKHMVNDGLAPNLLASILNNDIIQLNLIRSELVGVKKNAGWFVNDAKRE